MPSIFECINQRADAIKASKWEAYRPLTRHQLRDTTPKPQNEDNPETVTMDVGVFGQFVVLKRPTENAALRGDKYRDLIVERKPRSPERWCIYCKDHHPPSAFVHSARYLHHLSYACKTSLKEARRRPWQHLSAVA